jgi:uroporphyrinogen decarboxylase
MMTPLERFEMTFKFQEPDRVPWTPFFWAAARRVYGAPFDQWAQWGDMAARCMMESQVLFGFDVMFAAFDRFTEAGGFGQEMVFPEENPPHPVFDNPVVKSSEDYGRLASFDPKQAGTRTKELIECCEILMNEKGDKIPVIAVVNSPLIVLAGLRSGSAFIDDIENYRDHVIAGLETVSSTLTAYTRALAETGAMVMFDTSFACRQMMSRDQWLETEGRFMPLLAETARKAGAAVAVHNAGEGPYWDILADAMKPGLISTAFLPEDCKDWGEMKRKWADQAALCGAISDQVLRSGKPAEVKEECRSFIQQMADGGGYILSPGFEYPPHASLSAVRAMKEAVENYGTYPIQRKS